MPNPRIGQFRRALILASALALIPAGARGREVMNEFHREQMAQVAMAQASVALSRGEYVVAAARFVEVLTLAPRAVEAYGGLAEAEFRRGNIDGAVAAYRSWLAIYPYTYVPHLYREVALIEVRSGRFLDARWDLEQAVMLDPTDWFAFHLLGHAHQRLGDREAARIAWRRVIALQPGYEPTHEQLRRLGE